MGIGMTPRTLGLTDLLHQYLMQVGFREPQPLKLVREQTAPLPGVHMMIAPEQAQFMALLTRLLGVRRYLEIGTYTGYSALAVALAMGADGRVRHVRNRRGDRYDCEMPLAPCRYRRQDRASTRTGP